VNIGAEEKVDVLAGEFRNTGTSAAGKLERKTKISNRPPESWMTDYYRFRDILKMPM